MFLLKTYKTLGVKVQFAEDLNLQQRQSNICLAGHEMYNIMIAKLKEILCEVFNMAMS